MGSGSRQALGQRRCPDNELRTRLGNEYRICRPLVDRCH
ncbi:Uncharacterised protein [Bordetella pertussis]|nr:Uncharacterised protein [Bordetella pertussis]